MFTCINGFQLMFAFIVSWARSTIHLLRVIQFSIHWDHSQAVLRQLFSFFLICSSSFFSFPCYFPSFFPLPFFFISSSVPLLIGRLFESLWYQNPQTSPCWKPTLLRVDTSYYTFVQTQMYNAKSKTVDFCWWCRARLGASSLTKVPHWWRCWLCGRLRMLRGRGCIGYLYIPCQIFLWT